MYETVSQTTYTTNLSYYSVQPNPYNPPPSHFHTDYNGIQYQPDPFPTYGPYPPPNYVTYDSQPSYYTDPNVISHGIQPSRKEAVGPASHGPSMNKNLFGRNPRFSKKKLKKPQGISKKGSVSQSVLCNLCKIECNSIQHYEKHLTGKKHNKSFKKMYVSTIASAEQSSQSGNNASETGAVGGPAGLGVSNVPPNLEARKQKLLEGGTAPQSLRVCTICNVACNGEIAFSDHLAGKKHIAQERGASNPGTNSQNTAKKTTSMGQAFCDICKISCTSSEALVTHRQGKKHKKNVEKLRNSISDITGSSSCTALAGPASMSTASMGLASVYTAPVGPTSLPTAHVGPASVPAAPVGPASVPPAPVGPISEPVQGTMLESKQVKKKKKGARSMEPEDLETKKRKIMECGADANAVRTCDICNVVCNSDKVFNAHLAGQKHALLVKRADAGGAPNNQLVMGST